MTDATKDAVSLSRRRALTLATGLGAACVVPGLARAAGGASNWPDRPIRMIVGYPPGGGTDTVARLTAVQLSKVLNTQVIIDNRPGASSTIGTEMVVRAAPDGYTILFSTASPLTGAPLMVKDLPYDPFTDLKPVIFIGGGPFILVANPKFPPNTLQELVEYARARPGQVNYASPGNSTADYFFCELLNIDANIKTVAVHYKGSAALLNDVMGGYVQYTLDTPGTTLPLIKAGKLKPIAVLSDKRLSIAPDIPTAKEAGYPRLVGGSWYGMMAPKGTPDDIVQKLYEATKKAMATPDMVQGLAARDVIAQGLAPAEFGAFIKAEYSKWKEVTEKLGIQPQ